MGGLIVELSGESSKRGFRLLNWIGRITASAGCLITPAKPAR